MVAVVGRARYCRSCYICCSDKRFEISQIVWMETGQEETLISIQGSEDGLTCSCNISPVQRKLSFSAAFILLSISIIIACAMADQLIGVEEGILKAVSDMPPTHYAVKLEGFSLLVENDVEKYVTGEFEVGGYKWKMILYPKGNKSKNSNDNISVYLIVSKSSLPHLWSNVNAIFRVFLLDQRQDNYYTLQVANGKRFHKMKLEWGFDQFMPLEKFNNLSNGYLVNDTCVFGAEIYVHKETGMGEHLVMEKNANSYKHTWKIESFSVIIATMNVHESMSFNCGNEKWKIRLYPNGNGTGKGSHISIYIHLVDAATFAVASQIYAECTISLIDQLHAKNTSYTFNCWFSASHTNNGWPKFISLIDFKEEGKGYLVKDSCIIEAEITVHGGTTAL